MRIVSLVEVLRCLSLRFLPPQQYNGDEWGFVCIPARGMAVGTVVLVTLVQTKIKQKVLDEI